MNKITKSSKTYFFEDKPIFGLDIGHDELRVMQMDVKKTMPRLKAYGSIGYDPRAVADDVIVKPELIAHAAQNLFSKELVGDITTNRVAVSLPARRAFTRAVQLPKMSAKDMDAAVQTEVEQYIPVHTDNLYLDYMKLQEDEDSTEVFVIAMPRKIVDSYLALTRLLGLEAVLFDTAIGASAHLYAYDSQSGVPSVLIDFGVSTTDITVFSNGLVVTGAVAFGGDDITGTIAGALHITPSEAIMLKSRYGFTKSIFQAKILSAVEPSMDQLIKEIKRTIRYYEQRYSKQAPIGQIVTMGGGANMPGLAAYLTDRLRLAVRTFDPAAHIDFSHLPSFAEADHMSYVTAAGLAITNPAEIFR